MKASALGFKVVTVEYEMFKHEFGCIIGPKKSVGKYLAYLHCEPDNARAFEIKEHTAGFYFYGKDNGCPPMIWIPRFPRTPTEYETLTHEVAHAVTDMLEMRGVPITKDNDETFCYALGYGVRKILEAKRGR